MITMKALPKKDAEQLLTVKEIGKTSYINFAKERIEGESSIWETIKKLSFYILPTTTKVLLSN